jgi:hypothetical protein
VAVRFDQSTDRVTYSGALPNPADGFTFLMWAYVSVDTNANATLARLHVVAGDSTSVTFATDVDGLAGPAYFTGGGSVINGLGMVVAGWRRVAMSRAGGTGTVYAAPDVGATTVASGAVGGAANPTGITIGGRSAADDTESFNGRSAYARLFSPQLTQVQIEAEWASTVPLATGSLFADWPLSTAADLTDHSGNGRHLVAGSTAVTTEDGPPVGATMSGSALLSLPSLTVVAQGQRIVDGSMLVQLGPLILSAQQSQQRIRVSGREPTRRLSGREPRTHVTAMS